MGLYGSLFRHKGEHLISRVGNRRDLVVEHAMVFAPLVYRDCLCFSGLHLDCLRESRTLSDARPGPLHCIALHSSSRSRPNRAFPRRGTLAAVHEDRRNDGPQASARATARKNASMGCLQPDPGKPSTAIASNPVQSEINCGTGKSRYDPCVGASSSPTRSCRLPKEQA